MVADTRELSRSYGSPWLGFLLCPLEKVTCTQVHAPLIELVKSKRMTVPLIENQPVRCMQDHCKYTHACNLLIRFNLCSSNVSICWREGPDRV